MAALHYHEIALPVDQDGAIIVTIRSYGDPVLNISPKSMVAWRDRLWTLEELFQYIKTMEDREAEGYLMSKDE